jgi:acetylornithine/N-succinyldiaminopimelate aminotransferase
MATLPTLLERAEKHLYPNYRQPPLVILRGEGVYVWDDSDRRYLDLYAGIAVSALGHAHPRIVETLAAQAAKVSHLSNYFYNQPNIELATKLCQLTGFDRAFFCSTGTEANEAMLKLARYHFHQKGQADRYRMIAFDNSFHGRTLGSLALTGQQKYREGFGPLPGVTHVPFGDLGAVEAAMRPDVAGIIVETVQGEGGVLPASAEFLHGLRQIADRAGCLLLVDEIQTGVGRTGRFLGIEHSRVRPDAISLAKALGGGGMPIGAMLCREELSGALPPGSHGTTFGGNPLASAVALAVLDEIEKQDLITHCRELGAYLSGRLEEIAARYEQVECARGQGLLQALVLREEADAREKLVELRERGVLVTLAGGRAIRLSPPLIIQKSELDAGLETIIQVIGGA